MPKKGKTKTQQPDPIDFPPKSDQPFHGIAIDPGDRWTGVAFFRRDENGEWSCVDAQEFGREEFEDALSELIFTRDPDDPFIEWVVFEKWRLYADHAGNQTGSEFEASQLIGVIKYIVRVNNDHVERHIMAEAEGRMMTCETRGGGCEDPANRPRHIEIFKQGAEIKKPTTGILRKKGIKSTARPIARELYGNRDHIVDAELHGWKHILDTMKGKAAS